MKIRTGSLLAVFLFLAATTGCATYTSKVDNSAGRPTKYMDMEEVTNTEHVGIEAQDIAGICDKMYRSMMANPLLANAARPPHVLISAEGLQNQTSEPINLNILADKILTGLGKAANGRMILIDNQAFMLIEKQKKLKAQGVTGQGTLQYSKTTLGVDYQLVGRITELQKVSNKTGLIDRATYLNFRMVDMQTGQAIWFDDYEFRKSAADDLIYR